MSSTRPGMKTYNNMLWHFHIFWVDQSICTSKRTSTVHAMQYRECIGIFVLTIQFTLQLYPGWETTRNAFVRVGKPRRKREVRTHHTITSTSDVYTYCIVCILQYAYYAYYSMRSMHTTVCIVCILLPHKVVVCTLDWSQRTSTVNTRSLY